MSINEPEHPRFAEASTAELPPQAPPTHQPSKSPTSLVRIRMWASRLESIFVRRLLVVGVLGVMVMRRSSCCLRSPVYSREFTSTAAFTRSARFSRWRR